MLRVGGGWNPPIKRRHGDSEVAGYVAWGDAAGEQLLGRLDLAVGHLPFAAAFATKLASDFKACLSPLDGKLPFHFRQAGHDVEEEASGCGASIDRIGQALELN